MQVVLLNDTRRDPNPGCQATVSALARHLAVVLDARVVTRPRGEGYRHFAAMAAGARRDSQADWQDGVDALRHDSALADALGTADLVVANLEGTFHDHSVGALALGGALALAHRAGTPVWAVNGSVEGIAPWLLAETLVPAAYVAAREPWSARWLRAHGVDRTTPSADAAFLIEPFTLRDRAARLDGHAFYTPGVRHATTLAPAAALADVLMDLEALTAAGWTPVFVQLEDREGRLAEAVRARGWQTADARAIAWTHVATYLRRFGLVVSGRYHVLIFAAMAGVPAIARPSNTHKIAGLLELLGCPDAWAPDTTTLTARLAAGVPAPVDAATIRRCQGLAQRCAASPAGGASASPPSPGPHVVHGLDWTPAADLPALLRGLRGALPIVTSISTVPVRAVGDGAVPVEAAATWRARLTAAGFAVTAERLVAVDDAVDDGAAGPTLDWASVDPLGDPAIGCHRVLTLEPLGARTATAPAAPEPAAGPGPSSLACDRHVRLLVGEVADFVALAPLWRALPSSACSVLLRTDGGDAGWHASTPLIEMWCRSHGVRVLRAAAPHDVSWHLPAAHGELVMAAPQGAAHPRTCHGGFIAAAYRHGWQTSIRPPARASDGRAARPADAGETAPPVADAAPTGREPLRIGLFGASSRGRAAAEAIGTMPDVVISRVFDNDAATWGTPLAGVPISRPDVDALRAVDVVLVTSMHVDAIVRQVADAGCGHALLLDVADLSATLV